MRRAGLAKWSPYTGTGSVSVTRPAPNAEACCRTDSDDVPSAAIIGMQQSMRAPKLSREAPRVLLLVIVAILLIFPRSSSYRERARGAIANRVVVGEERIATDPFSESRRSAFGRCKIFTI